MTKAEKQVQEWQSKIDQLEAQLSGTTGQLSGKRAELAVALLEGGNGDRLAQEVATLEAKRTGLDQAKSQALPKLQEARLALAAEQKAAAQDQVSKRIGEMRRQLAGYAHDLAGMAAGYEAIQAETHKLALLCEKHDLDHERGQLESLLYAFPGAGIRSIAEDLRVKADNDFYPWLKS